MPRTKVYTLLATLLAQNGLLQLSWFPRRLRERERDETYLKGEKRAEIDHLAKCIMNIHIKYLVVYTPDIWSGQSPFRGENTPLFPARCVFSCRESALSSFIATSPGASLASTPKAFFFSFPFGWQCSKLRLACAQLSSLLFLISKVPSISRRRLLLWRYSAAVRPSAIPIDVKIRENHVQLVRSKL